MRSEQVEIELCLRNTKSEVMKMEAQEGQDKQSLMEMRDRARIAEDELQEAEDALANTVQYIINQQSGIRITQDAKNTEVLRRTEASNREEAWIREHQ